MSNTDGSAAAKPFTAWRAPFVRDPRDPGVAAPQEAAAPAEGSPNAARYIRAAILLSIAALLGPVLVADVPPLTDYPNHLARFWLEGGGAAMAPISSMYRLVWDAVTNIGVDLLAVALVPLVGYDVTGRLLVAAAVVLPAVGGVFLWRVLHGRLHWWQLCFALLAWNMGLIMGFLNFEIGLGLAMLAAAADPALARRGAVAATLARAALAGLILLVHVFAFAFYFALLAAQAIGPKFRPLLQREALVRAGKSLLWTAGALALPAIVFLLFAPSLPGRQAGANLATAWSDFRTGFEQFRAFPAAKLGFVLVGVHTYADWLDMLTLAAIELPILASLMSRRLTAHAGMIVVTAGLCVCYFVFPDLLAGTAWVDRRFALMAMFTIVAALRPDMSPRPALIAAVCLLAVTLTRTSVIGWIWRERQADVASVARALDFAPPGAAILPLEHTPFMRDAPIGRYSALNEPTFRHLAALATPWRRAFTPILFAARGKQPVQVLAPWYEISEPDGGLPASANALASPEIYARAVVFASYLKVWRERFDYALVLNADVPDAYGPFVPPEGMELVKDEGFAQLYRIGRLRQTGQHK